MPTVDGRIDTVTLYREAAVVTRRARVQLAPGEHALEFVGLPLSLTDASVRVWAEAGGADVDVAQVRIGLYVAPRRDLPEPPDEAALRRVEREIRRLDRRIELARYEQESLQALESPDRPDPPEGQPPGPSPLVARLALDDFVHTGATRRRTEIGELEAERARLERQRRDLQQRLALVSSAQRVDVNEVTKSAQCRVRVGEGGETPVEVAVTVQYQVPGPRWVPAYQVRVQGETAEIALRALVVQQSGEDWTQVRLDVSTADPASWTALPTRRAQRIGRKQTFAEMEPYREPPSGAHELFGDYDAYRRAVSAPRRAQYMRAVPPVVVPMALAPRAYERRGLVREAEMTEPPRRALGRADLASPRSLEDAVRAKSTAGAPGPQQVGAVEEDEEVFGGAADEGVVAVAASRPERLEAPAPSAVPMSPRPRGPKQSRARRTRRQVEAIPVAGSDARAAVGRSAFEAQILDELQLDGPDGEHRGRLRRVDRTEFFEQTARRSGRPLAFEIEDRLRAAVQASQAAAGVPFPVPAAPPTASTGAFDYTYPGEGRVDVPSDGSYHSIPLSVRTGSCEVTYVTVPRADPSVYRQARLENPEASPLLPGSAEIYVDGEYVLTAWMPVVPGRGRFDLGLGVEQAIRCARNVRFREARSSDTVVATNDLHHELSYVLANDLERDVVCEVRERVPIPAPDAEVVVEERDVEPAWEVYTQQERKARVEGGRRWRLTLPARGEVRLAATYVVRIYANHQVAGGNRRER